MPDLTDDSPVLPIDLGDVLPPETTRRVVMRARDGSATLVTVSNPLPPSLAWFATESSSSVRRRVYTLVVDAEGRAEYREG